MKKLWTGVFLVLGTMLVLSGCSKSGSAEKKAEREIFAMDTYMSVTAYGEGAEAAAEEALEEIERLDALLSTGKESSEICALNQNGGGKVSEDTAFLLKKAQEIWKNTDGSFEIAIYPLMQAWGFADGNYIVPEKKNIKQLLSLADSEKIVLDEQKEEVTFLQDGMQIDLGGIAKGYTSDQIMKIFRKYAIASGMVNLGGNVQVLGKKPDGETWKVAVKDPQESENYLGVLHVSDRAVITSGGYERYFEEDGKVYSHILDPKTGYPADNTLTSVTIVSEDGTLADALSTALFVMGKEDAMAYWRTYGTEFDMILAEEDGTVSVTEELFEAFVPDESVLKIEKIQK